MSHENQNTPNQSDRHLSDLERYVLDMGNRFSDAVMTDASYSALQNQMTSLDYNINQLERYPSGQYRAEELRQLRAEKGAQFESRKLLLVDLWEESHGDEGIFTRLVRVEDLRAEVEVDPEKYDVLDEYREAKADLDEYRFKTNGMPPSSP